MDFCCRDPNKKFKKVTKICVDGQKKILSDLGIKYDSFDYESDYIGKAKKAIDALQELDFIFLPHTTRGLWELFL